jgi:hypothetical protein
MFESARLRDRDTATAEERLWRAVIARTLEEWVRGPLRYRRLAEQYLFNDNSDFLAVCSSAGMDPGNLRKRLQSIRARGMQRAMDHLPARRQTKSDVPSNKILEQTALSV